jgi:hypothetical protein
MGTGLRSLFSGNTKIGFLVQCGQSIFDISAHLTPVQVRTSSSMVMKPMGGMTL